MYRILEKYDIKDKVEFVYQESFTERKYATTLSTEEDKTI